ncbi:MAG: hypothetical protein K8H86_08930 [Ignavibacteriaceae bacterium]|nr:hypothetical protein [Ignavibacteriaceae bacterium]
MLNKKKRLSRKEIKEDKLLTFSAKAYNFVNDNKQRIMIWTVAVAVVIVAVIFYKQSSTANNEAAGLALSRVMNYYDNGQYQQAIDGMPGSNVTGLKQIIEQYGSSENGEIAKIYLANSYFMLDKLEDAYKYYSDYGGGLDIYKAAALAGEAGYFGNKNEYKKAADLFRQASRVSEDNALNPEYMLKASINYIKAGNKEEAKTLLEVIKKDFTASSAFREVDKYLAQVN